MKRSHKKMVLRSVLAVLVISLAAYVFRVGQ